MLGPYQPHLFSDSDLAIFDALVPYDHWVRRAETVIDFPALRAVAEPFYHPQEGAPCVEPILLIIQTKRAKFAVSSIRMLDGEGTVSFMTVTCWM